MTDNGHFIDYYDVLRVDPNCDERALEVAYRDLAKLYHPDHSDTADAEKLGEVIAAYRGLRSPDDRAKYDLRYAERTGFVFSDGSEVHQEQRAALSDAEVHAKVLRFLYKRRREHAQDAGIGRYFVQEMLDCSDQKFEFHLWYLKAKGFIETTEQGTLAITIEGVDHVISTSRTAIAEKLLITQSERPLG